MHHTFSEFLRCKDWGKAELCDLINTQHENMVARGKLIRDMYDAKVADSTCMNLETGERFVFGQDAEEISNWKERMKALGIEVDNDESQAS